MKCSDIVYGEEYAIEVHSGYYVRGLVVEVGPWTRTVYTPRGSYRGHQSTIKGVRFARVNEKTGHVVTNDLGESQEEWCVPAKVTMVWSAWKDAQAQAAMRRQSLDDTLSDTERRAKEAWGIDVHFARTTHHDQRMYAGQASVSASDMRKALDAYDEAVAETMRGELDDEDVEDIERSMGLGLEYNGRDGADGAPFDASSIEADPASAQRRGL